MANNFSLQAMLTVLGQGIEHAVYMMQSFISIKGSSSWKNGSDPNACDRRFMSESEMVDVDLPNKRETLQIRDGIFFRRFIATMLHYEKDIHWVAAIFDRVTAQLYVFDTIEAGRKRRAGLALLAWRQFGANLGFRTNLSVVSPPIPTQPNAWCCGFIGLVMLHQTLRGLVGQRVADLGKDGNIERLTVDGVSFTDTPHPPEPNLLIPDWTFGAKTTDEGFQRASALLRAIMCNEVGVRSTALLHEMLRQPEAHPTFEFRQGFPGEPISFHISGSESWPRGGSRIISGLYMVRGAKYIHGFVPIVKDPTPPGFPALDVSKEDFERQTGHRDRDEIMRLGAVRCWNRHSSHFSEVIDLVSDGQLDAMTISSSD